MRRETALRNTQSRPESPPRVEAEEPHEPLGAQAMGVSLGKADYGLKALMVLTENQSTYIPLGETHRLRQSRHHSPAPFLSKSSKCSQLSGRG